MPRRFSLRFALALAFAAPLPGIAQANSSTPHSTVILRSGDTVRRFRLDPARVRPSGRHEIHLAHDESSGEAVAVKLEAIGSSAGHPHSSFGEEHQAAATSRHPHVLSPLGLGSLEGDSDRGVEIYQLPAHAAAPVGTALASRQSLATAYARLADSTGARALGDETYGADPRGEAKRSARALAYLITGIDSEKLSDLARAMPPNVRPAHTGPGDLHLHAVLSKGLAGHYESPEAFLAAMKPFVDGTPLVPHRRIWARNWYNSKNQTVNHRYEADAAGWVRDHFINETGRAWVHFNVDTHELRVTQGEDMNGPGVNRVADERFKGHARETLFPGKGGAYYPKGKLVVE